MLAVPGQRSGSSTFLCCTAGPGRVRMDHGPGGDGGRAPAPVRVAGRHGTIPRVLQTSRSTGPLNLIMDSNMYIQYVQYCMYQQPWISEVTVRTY